MADKKYQVIIVGAGPAGYVAAIRCAQLGLATACIDRWIGADGKPALGGTCLNVGCIPSKALLESSELYVRSREAMADHGIRVTGVELDLETLMQRKERVVRQLTGGIETLFKAHGIDWLQGRGRLLEPQKVGWLPHGRKREKVLEAEHIILAPGSRPVKLQVAPLDGESIVDSSGALAFDRVPRRLGIIGAGVIGLELGSVWQRLGSEVVLLEAQPRFLAMADQQIATMALRTLREQGLDIRLDARVLSASRFRRQVKVAYQQGEERFEESFDRLVVAVGRRPNTDDLAAPEAGLLLDERGLVDVDERCATNLPNVWAIGDVVRGPMLAHKGSEEGVSVAERIAWGDAPTVNYEVIPSVIYTEPEIAWVGRTEQQLRSLAIPYRSGSFPFAASGRARAMGEESAVGSVKLLAHAETDEILGAHMIGPGVSELVAEVVVAMEMGASAEDLGRTVHAHPTLSEVVREAALGVEGEAIHLFTPRRPS